MDNVQYENLQVLNLVQASLGAISNNFRVVGLSIIKDKVVLIFILERENENDREEIEDIVFEFESLQMSIIDIELIIVVDPGPLEDQNFPDRLIYRRKEI